MDEEYDLVLVVIHRDRFENLARSVDSWALIGDSNSFDIQNGLLGLIERNWHKISD